MTGFANIEDGIAHFFQRLGGQVDADLQPVLAALHASVMAVEAVLKEHGPEFFNALTAGMATAAIAGITGGAGTAAEIASIAGKAALAAGEAVAAAQGKQIAVDALRALATAAVTTAKGAALANAPATAQ